MSRRALIAGFFVLLFVLHQDFWWRDDPTLVLGVLPVSLAYHVFWTVLVAAGWFLVTKFCWPHELDGDPTSAHGAGSASGSDSQVAGGTRLHPAPRHGKLPALPGAPDTFTTPDRPPR